MLSRGSAASSYCTTSSSSSSSSSAQSGVNMSLLNELEMSAGSVGGKTPLHLSLRRYGHRIRGQKNTTNGKKTTFEIFSWQRRGQSGKNIVKNWEEDRVYSNYDRFPIYVFGEKAGIFIPSSWEFQTLRKEPTTKD